MGLNVSRENYEEPSGALFKGCLSGNWEGLKKTKHTQKAHFLKKDVLFLEERSGRE